MANQKNNPQKITHQPAAYHSPSRLRSWLIGHPLPTADAEHQAIGKRIGLALFASDALSSTAYATQEILVILAAAGTAAFGYAFPIAVAIVVLLAIVAISYEQTIHAYPSGGGAYIVSRDNLGELAAQIAGAALLTDYILTVSVSVSAGMAQLVSAFPDLVHYRVFLAVIVVMLIMLINLRGVKESGTIFAIPTYFFLIMLFLTVLTGFARVLFGGLGLLVDPPPIAMETTQAITFFLLLHAFSSGTTALTGVEAITNGITAFKEPRSKNAGQTLVWMAVILGTLFLSITFLAGQIGAVPSEAETVISQLARTIFRGRGLLYLSVIGSTTLILVMAANTAFADFPRLSALQALDKYLPRQLTYRGSRLVYSWGIVSLAMIAALIIIFFQANVTALIPLYAIGVFLSFTLSQAGMAHRWLKIGRLGPEDEIQEQGSTLRPDSGWRWKMVVNGFGALCTAIVMLIFALTKFRDGAWVVLVLIPVLVSIFFAIHRHYLELADHLSLSDFTPLPTLRRQRVILPISGVHKGTLKALRYARSLSPYITAVYVAFDEAQTQSIQQRWGTWAEGIPLVVIDSPYRELMHPLVNYIEDRAAQNQPDETLTVVVPEFIPGRWWHNFLHMQNATWLRWALRNVAGVVVVDVTYHVEHPTLTH
ncbi:MAG: APC family permease [Anaerolineales bacterium]|nr:APC family permease [Anaerolineales bacterium]